MKMDSNKMGRPRINLKEKSKELTEKEYYTINELASIMKVERRTIKRAIERGEIKALKIGKQWRIRKSNIQ